MKLKPYPKTKPSGVEWLGDVPDHWDVKRLKTEATCFVSNVDKVPSEDELPVRLCNYTDVYYNDRITPDMGLMETTATIDEIRRFGLKVGDVLITKDSEDWTDIAVPALVSETAPDLVCGYHLGIIRSRSPRLFGDYLLRAFQSCAVNQQFQIAASGVTRYGLPKSAIGNAWLPFPTPAEQTVIAAYLDRETGRIDELVGKKRELIERLKEKRTALISRTVTRGLPADLPPETLARLEAIAGEKLPTNSTLKPSGIDWLGDVPEHWAVKKVKFAAKMESGHTPSRSEPKNWIEDECVIPWVSLNDSKHLKEHDYIGETAVKISEEGMRNSSAHLLPSGVVVFTRDATIGLTAITTCPAAVSQHIIAWVPRPEIRTKYLLLSFKAMQQHLESFTFGSTLKTIGMPDIRKLVVSVPPLPEQDAIAAFLDQETAKLDALVAKVETAIERLQEYRTALITAAVTGKIDVGEEAMA